MKETYTVPVIDVIGFETEDVIRTSIHEDNPSALTPAV